MRKVLLFLVIISFWAVSPAQAEDVTIDKLNQRIEANPDDGHAYYLRAQMYKDRKHYIRAIMDYDKAIEIEPNATYYFLRAGVYEDLKQYPRAIQDYDKAIELEPGNSFFIYIRGSAYANL